MKKSEKNGIVDFGPEGWELPAKEGVWPIEARKDRETNSLLDPAQKKTALLI